jgi:hypothetical protein
MTSRRLCCSFFLLVLLNKLALKCLYKYYLNYSFDKEVLLIHLYADVTMYNSCMFSWRMVNMWFVTRPFFFFFFFFFERITWFSQEFREECYDYPTSSWVYHWFLLQIKAVTYFQGTIFVYSFFIPNLPILDCTECHWWGRMVKFSWFQRKIRFWLVTSNENGWKEVITIAKVPWKTR